MELNTSHFGSDVGSEIDELAAFLEEVFERWVGALSMFNVFEWLQGRVSEKRVNDTSNPGHSAGLNFQDTSQGEEICMIKGRGRLIITHLVSSHTGRYSGCAAGACFPVPSTSVALDQLLLPIGLKSLYPFICWPWIGLSGSVDVVVVVGAKAVAMMDGISESTLKHSVKVYEIDQIKIRNFGIVAKKP